MLSSQDVDYVQSHYVGGKGSRVNRGAAVKDRRRLWTMYKEGDSYLVPHTVSDAIGWYKDL